MQPYVQGTWDFDVKNLGSSGPTISVSISPICTPNLIHAPIHNLCALIDTGSDVTYIHPECLARNNLAKLGTMKLYLADGKYVITSWGMKKAPDGIDILIGNNVLNKCSIDINYTTGKIVIGFYNIVFDVR